MSAVKSRFSFYIIFASALLFLSVVGFRKPVMGQHDLTAIANVSPQFNTFAEKAKISPNLISGNHNKGIRKGFDQHTISSKRTIEDSTKYVLKTGSKRDKKYVSFAVKNDPFSKEKFDESGRKESFNRKGVKSGERIHKSSSISSNQNEGIILNNDTTICFGDSVTLLSNGQFLDFTWQASTGGSVLPVRNPVVRPSVTTMYTLIARNLGANIVVNNDFSQGNTGFTSSYSYNSTSGFSAGVYNVGPNIQAWHSGMAGCTDHTSGSGNMMMVNGANVSNVKVWSQAVPVQPNSDYAFSTWLQHITTVNPALLKFTINGVQIGNLFSANSQSCKWEKFYATWNSGSATSATISIENMNQQFSGNDFALDDIFFGKFLVDTDSIKVTVAEKPLINTIHDSAICPGSSITLTTNSSGASTFNWSPAAGLSNPVVSSPLATPSATTQYVVTAFSNIGCSSRDTVLVSILSPQECNASPIIASFSAPDTVCINTPISLTNASSGATSYYWNFCVASSLENPTSVNLGNFGFNQAVSIDYAQDGNNWYAFVTSNIPGKLTRLNFGNSLLNTPTAYDFGNFAGAIPDNCGGIQVIKNGGRWYAIIVGGTPLGRIIKIDFGSSLSNNSPVATNWGNIGNLALPTDLNLFQSGGAVYGLTTNAVTNTVTRFDFTNSFINLPTGVNLGNVGSLNYPTGIYTINKGGAWYAFITNAGSDQPNSPNSSVTRLNFGNSLLNIPTGTNLGNLGNTLRSARDLTIYQSCNDVVGFVTNNSTLNDLVRLNFNNDITSTPAATTIGNSGSLDLPRGISKIFRVGNDLYSFVTNANNASISRLKFNGCSNASIAGSTLQNPNPIVYNLPGTYNIVLTIDEGLSTQASVCRNVVVLPSLNTPTQHKTICQGDSILLTASFSNNNLWGDGSISNAIYAKNAGTYWAQSTNPNGCIVIDSFVIAMQGLPIVLLGKDTSICERDSLLLDAGNNGATFLWQDGSTTQKYTAHQDGNYSVEVTKNGCRSGASINVSIRPLPTTSVQGDSSICVGGKANLFASGGSTYSWLPATDLSDPANAFTVANPVTTTQYVVTVTDQTGCSNYDSITINVTPKPVFNAFASKPVLCLGDTVLLTANGGDSYVWSPASVLSNPYNNSTKAFPLSTTQFKVLIDEKKCDIKDSIFITLPVVLKPSVTTTKSNDINCFQGEAVLHTGGGTNYLWQPSLGLSDSTSDHPTARVNATTNYIVTITTAEGCVVTDSVTVVVSGGEDGKGFPVPNAFTPNGDGKNDCFGVKHWGDVADFSMNLYNRWGELVFHANNPLQCWDGWYKGKLQPSDTFVYWIKAKTRCGNIFRKGTFTLIR